MSPKTLPKKTYAPVTVNVNGKISTKDGTHPAAFREGVIDFDKNGKIDTKGLPVCKGGQLEARNTASAKKVCGKAVVGSGNGLIQIAFPEQTPIPVKARSPSSTAAPKAARRPSISTPTSPSRFRRRS